MNAIVDAILELLRERCHGIGFKALSYSLHTITHHSIYVEDGSDDLPLLASFTQRGSVLSYNSRDHNEWSVICRCDVCDPQHVELLLHHLYEKSVIYRIWQPVSSGPSSTP